VFLFNQILCLFELSVSCNGQRAAEPIHLHQLCLGKGRSILLDLQPALYFMLTSIMDASMSTGRLALEHSETMSTNSSSGLSIPLDLLVRPELSVVPSSCPRSNFR
jgi:hypothetical protein